MNQPFPPYQPPSGPAVHGRATRADTSFGGSAAPYRGPHGYSVPQPANAYGPYEPVPESNSSGFRYVVLACVTLVVLAGLVLAGMALLASPTPAPLTITAAGPQVAAPATAIPDYSTVVAAPPASSTGTGGSSCGTVSGHEVDVVNGTVPCAHALTVAGQWLVSGSTPGDGNGSAGTMYSWSCASDGSGGGYCTSRMGSHLSIRP